MRRECGVESGVPSKKITNKLLLEITVAVYLVVSHISWIETGSDNGRRQCKYSQLSPCGHLAITETPIIQTAAKSAAKTNYTRLTELNSRYYGVSLMTTPIIRTTAKSHEKIIYRRLNEIKARYYGLSLMRTLTRGPYSVRYKGS